MVVKRNDEIRRHKAAELGVTQVTKAAVLMGVGWPATLWVGRCGGMESFWVEVWNLLRMLFHSFGVWFRRRGDVMGGQACNRLQITRAASLRKSFSGQMVKINENTTLPSNWIFSSITFWLVLPKIIDFLYSLLRYVCHVTVEYHSFGIISDSYRLSELP